MAPFMMRRSNHASGSSVTAVPGGTGEEALDWLEGNVADLILMNSVLPNMQGEEVCKQLKSNDKLKHIPIILYNAKCDISEKAKQVRANDCMVNPFNSQDLLFKIKKLIG